MATARRKVGFYATKCNAIKVVQFVAMCIASMGIIFIIQTGEQFVTTLSRPSQPTKPSNTSKCKQDETTPSIDTPSSESINSMQTLDNDSSRHSEHDTVTHSEEQRLTQRRRNDTKLMVDKIIHVVKTLSNLKNLHVIDMLKRTLRNTTSDLGDLYQKLELFKETEECPSCRARKGVPVTCFGTEARIEYHDYWEGRQLPVFYSDLTNGRLGNQMGAYATMYAIKEHFNATVIISAAAIEKLRKTFRRLSLPSVETATQEAGSNGGSSTKGKGPATTAGDTHDDFQWTALGREASGRPITSMQLAALGLLGPQYFAVTGYPFEFQLFHSLEDKLKEEFTFADEDTEKARLFLRSVTSAVQSGHSNRRPVIVGIHIRLGDYINHMAKLFSVESLDYSSYLSRAMKFYESLYDHVVFVVTSDDIINAIKFFRGRPNVFFPAVPFLRATFSSAEDGGRRPSNTSSTEAEGGGRRPSNTSTTEEAPSLFTKRTPQQDMSLLVQCNHTIITLGSFGFFSAYLGSGKVLYPDIGTRILYPQTRPFYEQAKLDRFIPIPCNVTMSR